MNELVLRDDRQPAEPANNGALSVFASVDNFANAQRMAKALASSTLVPEAYRGEAGMGNCLIAMEVASTHRASVLAVMQSLNVIEGRPSWSSQYVIAAINSCGRFAPLRFDFKDGGTKKVPYTYWDGPRNNREKKTGQQELIDKRCIAWTVERGIILPPNVRTLDQAKAADVPVIEGPPVSYEIAVMEGWWHRGGSKWQTMPELMLTYRAGAFFGRIHAPDVLMGMHTEDEMRDIIDVTPKAPMTVTDVTGKPSAGPDAGEPSGKLHPAAAAAGKRQRATGQKSGDAEAPEAGAGKEAATPDKPKAEEPKPEAKEPAKPEAKKDAPKEFF